MISTPYEDLLRDVLENGAEKGDRTGTGTRSVFGRQIRYDLSESFPLLTTKKVYFKGVVGELLTLLEHEAPRDNLVSSACLGFFEQVHRDHVRCVREHLLHTHAAQLERLERIPALQACLAALRMEPDAAADASSADAPAADVAAVLVRLRESDPRSMISTVKGLAPAIQNAGAALLIDGHPDIVARAGADGAHLTGIAAMEEAMPSLRPDRIVGVGGLATRHDSMAAGEAGADYVLFGEPDAKGQRPSAEAIAERLEWWDELFEPPCVGFATSREEAEAFAAAGADFVLVGDVIWSDPRGARAALVEIGEAITRAHADTFGTAKAEG